MQAAQLEARAHAETQAALAQTKAHTATIIATRDQHSADATAQLTALRTDLQQVGAALDAARAAEAESSRNLVACNARLKEREEGLGTVQLDLEAARLEVDQLYETLGRRSETIREEREDTARVVRECTDLQVRAVGLEDRNNCRI